MARPQMLYLGNEGQISYQAIGNVEMGEGQKGSLSLWYHPAALEPRNTLVSLEVDGNNRLLLRRYMQSYIWRVYSDGSYRQIQTSSPTVAWRHVVATWNFEGGPGAGVLRLYLDGEEVAESPIIDGSAPIGPPDAIRMGPGPGNTYKQDGAVYDQMSIWNDEMSSAQVAALYAQGRLYRPQEEDGAGELLFQASWDDRYDADIAEGSGVMTVECEADEYCRLDVGSRKQGERFSYQVGMPRHDGSENDRVPLLAVLAKSPHGTVTVSNEDEWSEMTVSVGGNSHQVGVSLAPWLPAPTEPTVVRVAVHLDPSTTPHNVPIAVGPVSYIHGNGRRFICSGSSTKSKLYSDTLTEADDYWAGAELSVITGPSAGQKLRVLTNSASEKSLTLEGELSDAPTAGAVAIVEFPRRIQP
ncbi:MAG: LamG domain-containing protein, partial [Armatimonadetes bacterium]|nr:LamG domain-containing protein [Armatimonadota bacterium]